MSNYAPRWTQAIRQGDFQQAEEDLAAAAGEKLLPIIEQRYVQSQVNAEIAQINEQAGPYALGGHPKPAIGGHLKTGQR